MDGIRGYQVEFMSRDNPGEMRRDQYVYLDRNKAWARVEHMEGLPSAQYFRCEVREVSVMMERVDA